MKSTLVCVHVMPNEMDLFDRWVEQYKKALQYLDDTDDVTLMATLNLYSTLTDWNNRE
jgi:nicotinic acid phosphoribosyltransferase